MSPLREGEGSSRVLGQCGRSSGVERNLAKVEVEGSNPFARSKRCAQGEACRRQHPHPSTPPEGFAKEETPPCAPRCSLCLPVPSALRGKLRKAVYGSAVYGSAVCGSPPAAPQPACSPLCTATARRERRSSNPSNPIF